MEIRVFLCLLFICCVSSQEVDTQDRTPCIFYNAQPILMKVKASLKSQQKCQKQCGKQTRCIAWEIDLNECYLYVINHETMKNVNFGIGNCRGGKPIDIAPTCEFMKGQLKIVNKIVPGKVYSSNECNDLCQAKNKCLMWRYRQETQNCRITVFRAEQRIGFGISYCNSYLTTTETTMTTSTSITTITTSTSITTTTTTSTITSTTTITTSTTTITTSTTTISTSTTTTTHTTTSSSPTTTDLSSFICPNVNFAKKHICKDCDTQEKAQVFASNIERENIITIFYVPETEMSNMKWTTKTYEPPKGATCLGSYIFYIVWECRINCNFVSCTEKAINADCEFEHLMSDPGFLLYDTLSCIEEF